MAKNAADLRIIEYKDTIRQRNMTVNSHAETIRALQQTIADSSRTISVLTEKVDYLTKSSSAHPVKNQRTSWGSSACLTRQNRKQRHCPECGAGMEVIGKEFVRREFRFTPAKGEVVNIYRETAKCPVCSEVPEMAKAVQFVKANVPEVLIPHSYASASAVAWTMCQNYANSMPLYRQEQEWSQLGVGLNRATLANWIIYCSGHYFTALYGYLHRELLKRKFLMADETRIQVLKEAGRRAETDSFMWVFRSGEDGLLPIILYRYTETRAKFHAVEFLSGFSRYLETDCYQGYDDLPGVKRCYCWSHLRGDFLEAVPKGKELNYSNPAAQGVQYCNRLFE